MATGISGTAQISGYFLNILEDAIFVAREQFIMATLVQPYSATGWADRKFSIYPQITAQTVAETEDFATPTVFDKAALATLTPSEAMGQVILTDRRIETDPQSARADAATELGRAIGTKIEEDLVDLFPSFTASKGAGAGNAFTLTSLGNAAATLRANNVTGMLSAVVHPFHWLDVWVELGKPAATYQQPSADLATQALRDFFMVRLVGMDIYTHSQIDVDGSDDATGAIFAREAIALDTRRAPRMEPERDGSKRAWELNMTAGYGVGIRRNAFGVKMIADATAP